MKSYIAIVRQIGSECAISFPDLPGCEPAAGATMEAARKTASHMLALHLQELIETGEGIPAPSSIIEVVSDPQWRSEEVDAIILALRSVARAESS
jgi:predicted RNase H-like HicB family nuclease